jgi:DNA-binding winged helix-turn-helix (wHTH) protein
LLIGSQASPRFVLDAQEGTVAGPGGSVRLEPKVMEVLRQLSKHAGRVVPRDELMDAVWPGVVVTEHTLSRCIYQLRNQLATSR